MKDNPINKAMQSIKLSEDAKRKIKKACYEAEAEKTETRFTKRPIFRVIIVAAVLSLMTVSALAATKLIKFAVADDGKRVTVVVSVPDEIKDTETPLYAWNPDKDEIGIKLNFSYMPSDITEDKTSPNKYGGEGEGRFMTFTGIDLRRSDFVSIIGKTQTPREFLAGNNRAYLVTDESEIAVYNKTLFLLFESEQLLLKAFVGFGITEDEIKAIASGITLEKTTDASLALPISNTAIGSDADIPQVYVHENPAVHIGDVYEIGESAEYEDYFNGTYTVTLESAEVLDNISSLDRSCFFDFLEDTKYFVDENGNFIPYNRTEIDRENGKFGETVKMTKRMILVTVSTEGISEENQRPFLHGFKLAGLSVNEDGTIHNSLTMGRYVVDRMPTKLSGTHEPVYRKDLGDGRYILGYMLDADECGGNKFFYYSYHAKIYYSFSIN